MEGVIPPFTRVRYLSPATLSASNPLPKYKTFFTEPRLSDTEMLKLKIAYAELMAVLTTKFTGQASNLGGIVSITCT